MSIPFTRKLTNEIVQKFPSVIGFVRSGTFQGKDYDLWCITKDSIKAKTKKRIRRILHGSPDDIDLFFHTLKQFKEGDMGERRGVKAKSLLNYGLNPHEKQFQFDDTSMLGLYNYASAKQFGKAKKRLNPKIIFKKIEVTYEGIVDWTNFYTLAFLRHYIQNPQKKNERYFSRNYIERMAKLILRVAFGYFSARMTLKKTRRYITSFLRYKGSPDLKIYKTLTSQKDTFFGEDELNLLEIAAEIRLKDVIPKNIDAFMSEGINAIFFWSSYVGAEKRADRPIDQFIALALFDWIIRKEPDVYKKGEIIIKEGYSNNSDIYYVPPYKTDGKINGKLEVSHNGKRKSLIRAGRLIGEVMVLGGVKKRTATVTALQTVEIHRIKSSYLKDILSNQKDLIICERTRCHKDSNLRKLDILFRYLFYSSYEFLRSEVYTMPFKRKIIETGAYVKKKNSLKKFFLGKKLKPVFTKLYNSHYSIEKNSQMIRKGSYRKGEKIFSKGEKATHLLYIIDGSVSIHNDTKKSDTFVEVRNGMMIGESSLPVFSGRRLNSVYALTNVHVYTIDPMQFFHFTLTGSKFIQKYAPIELLYNLVAQNIGRLKYIEEVSSR